MAETKTQLRAPAVKLANPRDIWRGYDPDRAGRALERSVGAMSDLDIGITAEDIARWRLEGSRK